MAILGEWWRDLGTSWYRGRQFGFTAPKHDLLRFVPNGENATTGNIAFRAWDQTGITSGQQGSKVDTSINGGTTAFSSATEVASITVTAVNDNPVAVSDAATAVEAGGVSNGTAGTSPTGNVLANDTDVDAGDTKTVTGVSAGVQAAAVGSVATSVTGAFGSSLSPPMVRTATQSTIATAPFNRSRPRPIHSRCIHLYPNRRSRPDQHGSNHRHHPRC